MNKDSAEQLEKLKQRTGLPLSYDKTINGWQLVSILESGGKHDISRIKVSNKYFFRMLEAMNELLDLVEKNMICPNCKYNFKTGLLEEYEEE
jgi:hypothetical protein